MSPPVEAPPLAQPQSPPSLPVKQEPIKVELVPPKSVSAFSLTPQPAQTFVPPAAAPSQQKLIFENENSSMVLMLFVCYSHVLGGDQSKL